jgi:predicted negative regulator of RcsB-dependent stress response
MVEDWLPHEPPPALPARSSTGKTIAIWVVLVVMFVAIYWMVGDQGHTRPERVGYSGWWIAGAVAITVAVCVLLLVWVFGGAGRFNAHAAPGLEAIAEGNYAQASEMFERLARRYRTKPSFAAVASYNRGYALMSSGDTAAAVGILLGVERTPKLAAGGVRRLAATQLGRCFALAGDVDKAQHWLDATRTRPPGMADPVHDRANLDALAGLVLCRQGKLDEARRHYEQCWPRLCAYLSVHQMIEVWLLRAFAISASSMPRDAGAAEPWLRMLRGTSPGALDALTARWPELATFVVTHGLGTQQAA